MRVVSFVSKYRQSADEAKKTQRNNEDGRSHDLNLIRPLASTQTSPESD
jgi:hypothetical protein